MTPSHAAASVPLDAEDARPSPAPSVFGTNNNHNIDDGTNARAATAAAAVATVLVGKVNHNGRADNNGSRGGQQQPNNSHGGRGGGGAAAVANTNADDDGSGGGGYNNNNNNNTTKLQQLALLLHPPPPPPAVHTFEIQAINLSYTSPRPPSATFRSILFCPRNLTLRRKINPPPPPDTAPTNRHILKNVSFRANSGELLAIAGPSGAGKSTLLELLAGKLRPSSPPSSLLVNRRPVHVPTFRRISGYIPQNDALFPLLTVRETLRFSAHLRLPSAVSAAEKERRVESLLEELRLEHVAGCRIGDDNIRGISGGERRRVSIGVDVIHDPAVLLLDEPTSGLDSASALNVVEMLHSMAKTRSRTIILSIHQPGYRILQLIHTFLVLSHGSVAYHGSLSSMQYQLAAAGYKIPPHANVLEYAIECIAAAAPAGKVQISTDDGNKKQAAAMVMWQQSQVGLQQKLPCPTTNSGSFVGVTRGFEDANLKEKLSLWAALELESEEEAYGGGGDKAPYYYDAPTFACGHAKEVMILSRRFARNVFRTYELFTARTMQSILAGIALGTLYMKVSESERGAAERLGFFAFTLTFLLSSTVEALPIFLQERQVFIRETSRGAYRISSYLAANFVVFLPFLLLLSLLFSGPVYWLVGLNPAPAAFAFFVLIVWLVLLTANSFVAFFGALVPDYIMGNSIISGCMGAFFLFSGYFIAKEDMPPYWRFMHYVSLFKYPLDGLLINEYSTGGEAAKNRCFASAPPLPDAACSFTALDELRRLGLDGISKWCTVLMMLTFVFFYRFLCFVVLRFKVCRR